MPLLSLDDFNFLLQIIHFPVFFTFSFLYLLVSIIMHFSRMSASFLPVIFFEYIILVSLFLSPRLFSLSFSSLSLFRGHCPARRGLAWANPAIVIFPGFPLTWRLISRLCHKSWKQWTFALFTGFYACLFSSGGLLSRCTNNYFKILNSAITHFKTFPKYKRSLWAASHPFIIFSRKLVDFFEVLILYLTFGLRATSLDCDPAFTGGGTPSVLTEGKRTLISHCHKVVQEMIIGSGQYPRKRDSPSLRRGVS